MRWQAVLLWMICGLLLALWPGPALAQAPGELDPSFDGDGKVLTRINPANSEGANALVLQPDHKIVVAGGSCVAATCDIILVRYKADGSLDTSFDGDGKLISDFGQYDQANALALQPDGKLLIAGTINGGDFEANDFIVARYNPNGSLDASFGNNGKVITDFGSRDDAYALILQPDDKLVVAGRSDRDFALVRYNADGSLDTSFDGDGKLTTNFSNDSTDTAHALVLQPDKKIVAAGYSYLGSGAFALVRYHPNGSLDTSFDGDGKVTTGFFALDNVIQALGLQPDGKLVAAGFMNALGESNIALARYNLNGSLDPLFGDSGKVITRFGSNHLNAANALVLQPNSKIVVAGSTLGDFALVRYYNNGLLDATFDGDGKLTTDLDNGSGEYATALALQPDGKLIAAGSSSAGIVLTRYFAPDPHLGSTRIYVPLFVKQ